MAGASPPGCTSTPWEKRGLGTGISHPRRPTDPQGLVVGHAAERHDHPDLTAQVELLLDPGGTGVPLGRRGPVLRRNAPNDGGDGGVDQAEPVVPALGHGTVGETGPVQGPEQPLPGSVPREHLACPVRAMGSGRQPHDQQPGLGVPQHGHRSGPVLVVRVCSPLLHRQLLPPSHQARAEPAFDQLGLQPDECPPVPFCGTGAARRVPAPGLHHPDSRSRASTSNSLTAFHSIQPSERASAASICSLTWEGV